MSAETTRREIRIFISSPSDVRPERLIADRVIRRLAREFSYHLDVTAVLWEREPLLATSHFQDLITPPHQTDIVVAILWSRLGTQLPETRFRGPITGKAVTGTEWEFEDALKGYRDKQLPDLLLYLKQAEIPAILSSRSEIEERLHQKDMLDDFMTRWTRDATGKAFTAASWPFGNGAEFEAMLEEHLRRLLRRRLETPGTEDGTSAPTIRWYQGSPYRGLETFEREHEQIFFGRTRARNELRELLARRIEHGCAFVLVVGASGAGKSSLVKAGVVPDVCTAGMIGRVGLVRIAVTRPGIAHDLFDGLAAAMLAPEALPELAGEALQYTPQRLADLLRRSPEQVAQTMRQGLTAAGRQAGLTEVAEARLLLVVDQLEELFTVKSVDDADRRAYVAVLEGLARSGLVWVVATLRSDFFARLDEVPALTNLAQGEARYFLSLPDEAERAQIVRQPAREAGLHFEVDTATERGLDDEILHAASDAASLPLLEYLLDQLWTSRTANGELTYAAYRALGGLEGAIGARAEEVLKAQPPEVQAAFPRLLRALVTVGQGSRAAATARYADMAQFAKDGPERRLIDALLDKSARLLISDRDLIRVAHEALLNHWERARDQIAEDRADLQLRTRLEDAATRWRVAGEKDRPSLLLASGLPLSEGEDYVKRRGAELDGETRLFIESSTAAELDRQRKLREAEQAALRERLRRSRQFAIAVSFLLVLAMGLGGLAWYQRGVANEARIEAENNYRLALDQAAGSLRKMIDGYRDGAVANRMLADLVTRSLKTVDGLPGEADDVTAARSQLLDVLSLASVDLGDVKSARELATRALSLTEALARKHPNDAHWTLLQAESLEALSQVMFSIGDAPSSEARAREAILKLEPLVKADPGNEVIERDYMDCHERLGVALVNNGKIGEGEEVHKAWVAHAQALVAGKPGAFVWRRYLAMANEELSDNFEAEHQPAESAKAVRTAASIADQLLQDAPGNKDAEDLVGATSIRMGDILMREGDRNGAIGRYQIARARDLRLTSTDPSVYTWRQGYAITFQRLGDLYLTDDPASALKEFEKYVELTLVTRENIPESPNAYFDLANARLKLGDALRALGRLDEALDQYRRALAINTELMDRPVKNARWRRSLANDHFRIGLTQAQAGRTDEALAEWQACIAVGSGKDDWSPRERWPEDVTDECDRKIKGAEARPAK